MVKIYDTTLRDGEQTPGVKFSKDQKVEIARKLDELGVNSVCRRPTQVRRFLRDQLGLRWRKVAAVPVPPMKSVEEHAATQAAFLKYGA